MKIPAAKAAVDKEWEKLEKIPAWDVTKSEVKKRWSMKQGWKAYKFILFHWTSVIWRMPNWRQSTKNIKVELYSEAILWKMILDLMQYSHHQHQKWRLQKSWISNPDCQGAQDKQRTQYLFIPRSKWKMLQKYWKVTKSECPDNLDPSTATEGAKIMVQYGRPSRSSWTKSVRSSFGRIVVGNAIWEIQLKYGWERVSNWKCLFVHREKSYSYLCMWMTSNWLGKKQNLDPMWKVLNKEVDLGEPTSFFDHVYLGLSSETMWNKQRNCWQSQNHVWIQKFPQEQLKNHHVRKICVSLRGLMTWKDMPRNVWKDIVSWRTKRLNNSTKYQHRALTTIHFKEELKSVGELSKVCSQIVLKCWLKLGTYWKTWYSMVSEQICTSVHKMDQSLWQTIISFDFLHSSCMWIQTVLSCGKHCTAMQIAIVSRLRFCRRCWGFRIYLRWNIVHFPYVCSNQLVFQETNFSLAQFNRIRDHFFGCWIGIGRKTRTWFMGTDLFSFWKHDSEPHRTVRPVVEWKWSSFNTSHKSKTKTISRSGQWFGQCWFYSLKRQLFSSGSFVVFVWR